MTSTMNANLIAITNAGNGIVHARLTEPVGPLSADSLIAAAFYYAGTHDWAISDCLNNDAGPIKGKAAAVQALRETADATLLAIAVQADDQLLDQLGSATPTPDPADELATLLDSWRDGCEHTPIPDLVDTDTAVAAITGTAL